MVLFYLLPLMTNEGLNPTNQNSRKLGVYDRKLEGNHSLFYCYFDKLDRMNPIREIPDHATFREKCVNTGLVRQTWGLSLFGPM